MTNTTIKVGMIGVGGMAYAHRGTIGKLGGFELAAICDSSRESLDEIGETEGVPEHKRYERFEELIADPDVEAVISIVPNHIHAAVVASCIHHRKPIMAEKPFTLNFAEAEQLLEAYERGPVPCMVGFSYRYIPSFRYAKQLLEEGAIGTLRHIDIQYLQSGGAPIFNTPRLWRFERKYTGTGVLGDLGSHMIDSARFFAGEFTSVSAVMGTFVKERVDLSTGLLAEVDVDDCASFHGLLEGGVIGSFVTTRNAIGYGNHNEVALYGDSGSIRINCERPDHIDICVRQGEEWPIFRKESVPEGFARLQLADFETLLRSGAAPRHMPGFYDGYQNQKVLERLVESSETGRTVRV